MNRLRRRLHGRQNDVAGTEEPAPDPSELTRAQADGKTIGPSVEAPQSADGAPDALKDAENALRDFVDATMAAARGADWQVNPDLTSGKSGAWQRRREQDQAEYRAGLPEDRLLYYANLGELLDLVETHWDLFAACFGQKDRFVQLMGLLRQYRNQVFHGRDLLAHERQLVSGLAGFIRAAITKHRTKEATEMADRFFPRLEYLKDSLGNVAIHDPHDLLGSLRTTYLRVGCAVEFVAKAFDPLGEQLEYHFSVGGAGPGVLARSGWQTGSDWTWRVLETQVGRVTAYCRVRSLRPYHLQTAYDKGPVGDVLTYDDLLTLEYVVLPAAAIPGLPPSVRSNGGR